MIHDLEELESYMDNFQLCGGSATDFRPVFAYVEQLPAQGAFTRLRGLVYFTDGMGIYPKKRPPYDTAFVMMEEPASGCTGAALGHPADADGAGAGQGRPGGAA